MDADRPDAVEAVRTLTSLAQDASAAEQFETALAAVGATYGAAATSALVALLRTDPTETAAFDIIHLVEDLDSDDYAGILIRDAATHDPKERSWVDVLHFRLWNGDPEAPDVIAAVRGLDTVDAATIRAWADALASEPRNARFAATLDAIGRATE